jgi:hypothetical protein
MLHLRETRATMTVRRTPGGGGGTATPQPLPMPWREAGPARHPAAGALGRGTA